jgi:hyperosmotically inducible protein
LSKGFFMHNDVHRNPGTWNMSRSRLSCLLLFLLAAATSGCGALVVGGAGGGYHGARDERSAEQVSRDAAITSSINARYVQDDLVSAMAVKVDTYNGMVTLRGSLPSARAVERAVSLARTTGGVTRVVSRLTVAQ